MTPNCLENKKINQLEIDNYNIEEQLLDAEEIIFNKYEILNNDNIFIFSECSSES